MYLRKISKINKIANRLREHINLSLYIPLFTYSLSNSTFLKHLVNYLPISN